MRPSWDRFFVNLSKQYAEMATCTRRKCACILVKDKRIISAGFNGSLPGQPHCTDAGCWIVDGHCVRTQHAEKNAITNAPSHEAIKGCTAYIWGGTSCLKCQMDLIAFGAVESIVTSTYPDNRSLLLAEYSRYPVYYINPDSNDDTRYTVKLAAEEYRKLEPEFLGKIATSRVTTKHPTESAIPKSESYQPIDSGYDIDFLIDPSTLGHAPPPWLTPSGITPK